MISYFRNNSISRWLVLVLIILLLWVPLWLMVGLPLQRSELNWLIVGQSLWQGKLLYRDFWVNMEPVSAGFYALAHGIFGFSDLGFRGLALLVCLLASWQFDIICRSYDIFGERTYVPVLIFICWLSCVPSFRLLSPALFALCFLLVCLNLTFRHIRYGIRHDDMLILGFCIGMASLCLRSASLFILFPLVLFVLYSGTVFRQYILLILGFVFPFLCCFLFFYWLDAAAGFYDFFLEPFIFRAGSLDGFAWGGWAALLAIPSLWAVAAALHTMSANVYVSYQVSCQVGFLLWAFLAVVALWLNGQSHIWFVVLAAPAASAFLAWFFESFKKKWQANGVFYAFIVLLALPQWATSTHPLWKSLAAQAQVQAESAPKFFNYKHKKILILADIPACYISNYIATPYYEWSFAKQNFVFSENTDYYSQWQLYKNFYEDMPDVIYDPHQVFKNLLLHMPLLQTQYVQKPNHIYERKK